MCQKLRKLVFHTLVPAVLAALLLPIMAFAQVQSCSVSIPVEVKVTGSRIPADIPYRLVMKAITPEAPMPQSEELVLVNGGQSEFGPMVYTQTGDYQYEIYQNSEPRDRFTYDERIYRVTVRITNGENGELESQVWATDEASEEEKTESIVFTNNYKRPGGGGGGGDSGGGSDPDPDPDPGTDPNPGPGGPGTEVPKGDGLTEIGDNETPLGGLTLISEEGVPLGGLPKTGDTTILSFWILLAVLSGSGLVGLAFIRRRMD